MLNEIERQHQLDFPDDLAQAADLDKGTGAAVAAMASAVSALRQFRDDIALIGGWTNDPQAHVDTYSWMVQRIDNVTNPA